MRVLAMLLCAGCGFTGPWRCRPAIDGPHELRGVIARWRWTKPSGDVVHDTGPAPALDLMIDDPSGVTWGAGALGITAPVRIRSAGAASKIYEACLISNRLTIEAWVTPASGMQVGPARIATVSADGFERDVMLAQTNRRWVFRVRTSSTRRQRKSRAGHAGVDPARGPTAEPRGRCSRRQHAVDLLDGAEVARDAKGGTLQSWKCRVPGRHRQRASMTGSGPTHWLGEIERLVIYVPGAERTTR